MTQDQKNALKVMTDNIRIKLSGNSAELSALIEDQSDLVNKINAHIELSNDLKQSLNLMDDFINSQE